MMWTTGYGRLCLAGALLGMVASCGASGIGNPVRGADTDRVLPFVAKLTKGEDPRDFSIAVIHRGAGLEEVRESVRFEATKYCLLVFGASDADWVLSDATGDWAVVQAGDALSFNGRCTAL